ncbi:MAG TPA: hypothetical protein VKQ72_19925, partial [Aggregatilineales bacterium]|nr:hypothetical protein [Aggregatilineales bacterium]
MRTMLKILVAVVGGLSLWGLTARSVPAMACVLPELPVQNYALPAALKPITAANGATLRELAHIGAGNLRAALWSSDCKKLAIASDNGVWLYRYQVPGPELLNWNGRGAEQLAFNQDGSDLAVIGPDLGDMHGEPSVELWNV